MWYTRCPKPSTILIASPPTLQEDAKSNISANFTSFFEKNDFKKIVSEIYSTPTPTPTGLNTKEIKLELNDGYNKMNEHRFKKLDRQDKINKLNTKINKLLTKIYTSYDNNITPDTNTMKFY